MVYFDDSEVKVLREMLEYYDSCYDKPIPRECSELIGAIRFKVDSERIRDGKVITLDTSKTEDGVTE